MAITGECRDRVIRNEYTSTWHNRDEEVKMRSDDLRAQILPQALWVTPTLQPCEPETLVA